MAAVALDRTPPWTIGAPVGAAGLLGLLFAGVVGESPIVLLLAAALLGASVFAAVHHAEVLALHVGEPLGSILLALAVTAIEVALIVSLMLSGPADHPDPVARDTVFAAVMIVLNGIVGVCLVLGGRRHHEQRFRLEGASAALAVLGTLAVIALVLPNHTAATLGPSFAPAQLLVVGTASLLLYAGFIRAQTVRHRDYFIDAATPDADDAPGHGKPAGRVAAASAVLLPLSLVGVVLLAKVLSHPLERAIEAAGLPASVLGVVIAAVVLLPEGLAAAKASMANRAQGSLNLALGSALASIGLTIPAVALVSLLTGMPLILGLSGENTVLLVLTLFVSTLTLGTGRTTVLHGQIHLVLFAIFLLLAVLP